MCERVYAGHTALCVDAPCDDERLNRLLSGLSSAYMVCRAQPDGALYPLYGRKAALLGEDLSGILKYKGRDRRDVYAHAFERGAPEQRLCA